MATYSAVMRLTDNVSSTCSKIGNSMQRMQGTINGVGKSFLSLGNIMMVGAVVTGVKKLVDAFEEQEQANLKASQSAYAYGSQLGMTQSQIDSVYNTMQANAGRIQNNGIFGDEALLDIQSMALQMGFTSDQIGEMAQASADMTAKLKGSKATAEDLKSTHKMLADDIRKGSTRSFKALGLSLTENEQALYSNMTESERYAFVMEKVKNASAGADEQVRKSTIGGRLTGIANSLGDVTQAVAKLVLGFSDFNGDVPNWLATLDDTLSQFKDNLTACSTPLEGIKLLFNTIHEASPFWTDIAMTIGTIVSGFFMATKAMQAWTVAVKIFNAVSNMNPWVRMLTLGIALFGIITATLDAFGITWGDVWDGCVNIFNTICETIKDAWNGMVSFLKNVWNTFIEFFATVVSNHPLGMLIDKLLQLAGSNITVASTISGAKVDNNALGTSYFGGGLTHINEMQRGEIVNLPSGTQIIPHDVAVQQGQGNVFNVSVNISGNVIGNEEYTNEIGNTIVQRLQLAMNNM